MTKHDLKQLFDTTWHNDGYILQKYIHSKTKLGDPFDCRIRLEKNGRGFWEVAVYLVRIGSNQKVVSNVAQGGSVSRLRPFLESNFKENMESIKASIENIANKLPYKLESIFQQNLISLGLDIGIEKGGQIYLFEVETGPANEFAMGEIAIIQRRGV
nr:YheC/YheD family protein [Lentibacillus sp. CBA3610]